MKLNSTAVMQRRVEDKESLDDFPTPPWATRALCNFLFDKHLANKEQLCREPAANRGLMVAPLSEYFHEVQASDVVDYGAGFPLKNYLKDDFTDVDWTITNPPFTLAKAFVHKALATSRCGVAMILRIAFLEGVSRYNELFKETPPSHVLQFVERVPMVKGKYDPNASSATAYAWFVWTPNSERTELHWIPPCKKELVDSDKDFR